MSTNIGYDEMLKRMADFASSYIDPAWKKRKSGESHELPTDAVFSEIFQGFIEISSALDALKLIEELFNLAPPRSKRVDKDHYLKFLAGSYLQEMYILEQRLTAYATKMSRLYGNRLLPSSVKRVVYEPLKELINIRGAHVHQQRFSDERLNSVSTLSFFRRVGHELGEDLELEYKSAQLYWKNRVRENNKSTRRIVDQYCSVLEVVICRNGKVIFP